MNKSRFLELLCNQDVLQSENKSLYEVRKSEYFELASYEIVLQQEIFYQNRSQYVDLIKQCLNGEINCYTFQWDFFEIYYNDLKTFDELVKKVSRYRIL